MGSLRRKALLLSELALLPAFANACRPPDANGVPPSCNPVAGIVTPSTPAVIFPQMEGGAQAFAAVLRGWLEHPPRSPSDTVALSELDSAVDSLWAKLVYPEWSLGLLVAHEGLASLDIAMNSAHAYWRHDAPAAPMLSLLSEYSPSPARVALGLAAIHSISSVEDSMRVLRLVCAAMNYRDILLDNQESWWPPVEDRYAAAVRELEDIVNEGSRLLRERLP